MLHEAVKEVAVVRDDNKASLILLEVFLQNVERNDVKVVGGLVENEKVRLLHQNRQKIEPSAFPSAKSRNLIVQHIVREEKTAQKRGVVHCVKHRVVLVELHPALVIVADFERFAPFDCASVASEFPSEKVYERALPDSVAPDDSDAVIALELVAEVAEVAVRSVVEAHVLAIYNLGSQTVGKTGVSAEPLSAHPGRNSGHIDGFGTVDILGPLLEGVEGVNPVFGFAAAGAGSAPDPFQFPSEYVADLVGLGVPVRDSLVPLFQVVLVVAPVGVNRSPVHLHHGVAHAVEEIAVVGYHQKGAPAALEVGFEVFDGVDVQVVGGLVHYEKVRLGGKHLAEGHPLDPASGEFAHLLSEIPETEVREKTLDPQFILHQVLSVKAGGEFRAGSHHLVQYALFGVEGIFLLQKGYADVLKEHNLSAGVAFVLSRKNPHQRGLPGAVRSDKSNLIAFIYIEGDMLKKHLGPVGLRDVLYLQITRHTIGANKWRSAALCS